ncbi:carbohydrate ABC transporter permease [Paenibacillus sp. N4]|uniref:carbohydrate ABC transporter permease n=1 Tax=Paenibacillus vietnamensis TaxID=2590547 RepID=UPI001CD187E2|nr:carbohydrate ABC transporter permease [Paenibacillus vietnamensis]MCA0755904.1 carbohydrate ABC transporter permease [Paenibacillus vietnamensis]
MGMIRADRLYQLSVAFVLLLVGLAMIVPFFYILAVSFTDSSVYEPNKLILWPAEWSADAYKYILFGNGFNTALRSSLFVTLAGTPLALAISATFAYMVSKSYLPGRTAMLRLLVLTILFSPGLIPNYLVVRNLGLLESWWSLILPVVTNAWTVLVLKSFFQGIPQELEESAKIDGCNDMGIFMRIILPLSKAPLAAFTLFFAVAFWNTYFNAIIYINDSVKWPLQVYLQQIVLAANASRFIDSQALTQLQLGSTPPEETMKMAAVIAVMAPIVLVYPFLQKHFAQGVLIGSVKE